MLNVIINIDSLKSEWDIFIVYKSLKKNIHLDKVFTNSEGNYYDIIKISGLSFEVLMD